MSVQDLIYHYTDAHAMQALVRTKVAFATSVEVMNDASEISEGMRIFASVVRQALSDSPSHEHVRAQLEHIAARAQAGRIFPDAQFTVCAFSLSAERDSLAQWRAYAPTGGGFAVGYRPEQLCELPSSPDDNPPRPGSPWHQWDLVQCLYTRDEQRTALEDALRRHDELHAQGSAMIPDYVEQRVLEIASRIKNPAFAHEREWRLVARVPRVRLQFRSKPTLLVPYVTLRLPDPACIWIGPHRHQQVAASGVDLLFSPTSARVPVHLSPIPFRDLG